MAEFHEFKHHPYGRRLRKRVACIIRRMAIFRYSPSSLFRAQEQLIDELLEIEHLLKEHHAVQSQLRHEAAQLAKESKSSDGKMPDIHKEATKEMYKEANVHAFELRALKYSRWMLRYVGDGIAWRAYGFQREIIRALGSKEPVPFLSKPEGIDKERNLFRAIRNLGRDWLPLMHDLTNCIRTADFSVFRDGVLVRLFELKIKESHQDEKEIGSARNHGDRAQRQIAWLDKISSFIETGELGYLREELSGGKSLKVSTLERHNFESISKVVRLARKFGHSSETPENGLLYLAWRIDDTSVTEAIKIARRNHPEIFTGTVTFRSISPRYDAYHQYLPITAMDLPTAVILDVLFDRIGLITLINLEELEQYCRERGVPVKFRRGAKGNVRIIVESTPQIEVREGHWYRLMFEALSLDSFCALILEVMEEFSLTS